MFHRIETDPEPTDSSQTTGLTLAHAGLVPVAEYMRMSTDHQRYSIEYQCGVIRRYAVTHRMVVVSTYLDDGKSGLDLRGRPGLKRLLRDVIAGGVEYCAVLVYDVSRWGRFQDSDEAAYYEFMCKQAGVKVIYCSEPFDDSPMGGLFKNIKRVMAGEFSRNLSARVWGGQAQSVAAGFRHGGQPGYGLRRLLVGMDGKPKAVLEKHQHKALTTDKVVLIPGPREEVENVWWIYDAYALDGQDPQQIADELNARNPTLPFKWVRRHIHVILSSPKYAGDNVFNRTSQKLNGKSKKNPESMWVRSERAFPGLVTREYFDHVQALRREGNSKLKWTASALQAQLRVLLRKHGYLSSILIQNDPDTADAMTFIHRFGSIQAAFESVGYCSLVRRTVGIWNRERSERLSALVAELLEVLQAASVKAKWDAQAKILWVSTDRTFAVAIALLRCYRYRGSLYWHVERMHRMKFDECLAVRMDEQYAGIYDYHLFPASVMPSIPRIVFTPNSPTITPYKLANLDLLASRWRVNAGA